MDPLNLKTASTYVNNLLLARGLLRNGRQVDFSALIAQSSNTRADEDGDDDAEQFEKGRRLKKSKEDVRREETAVQVINLVHDLILRRDVCLLRLSLTLYLFHSC